METRLVLPWIFILQYLPLALEGLCDLVASFPFFDPHNRDGNSEDGYIKGVLLKYECESEKKKGTKIMSVFHEKAPIRFAVPFQVQMSMTSAHTFWNAQTFEIPAFLRLSKFWLLRTRLKKGTDSTPLKKGIDSNLNSKALFSVEKVLLLKLGSVHRLDTLIKPTSFVTSYDWICVDSHMWPFIMLLFCMQSDGYGVLYKNFRLRLTFIPGVIYSSS